MTIGEQLYKVAKEMFDKKIEHYDFTGCEELRDKVTDKFMGCVDDFTTTLDEIEHDVDYDLDKFDWKFAYDEYARNEAYDRDLQAQREYGY